MGNGKRREVMEATGIKDLKTEVSCLPALLVHLRAISATSSISFPMAAWKFWKPEDQLRLHLTWNKDMWMLIIMWHEVPEYQEIRKDTALHDRKQVRVKLHKDAILSSD